MKNFCKDYLIFYSIFLGSGPLGDKGLWFYREAQKKPGQPVPVAEISNYPLDAVWLWNEVYHRDDIRHWDVIYHQDDTCHWDAILFPFF